MASSNECICAEGFGMNLSCPTHGLHRSVSSPAAPAVEPPEWGNLRRVEREIAVREASRSPAPNQTENGGEHGA